MRANLPLKLRHPKVIPIVWLLLFAQALPLLDPVAIFLLLQQLQLRACSYRLYCRCHGEAPKNESILARPDDPLRAVNEDTIFCFVCARLRFAPASGVVVEGRSGLRSPTAFRRLKATLGFAPDSLKPQHFTYVLFFVSDFDD